MVIKGERNVRAAALLTLALAVSLERKGFRVTRGRSALAMSKIKTGLKTNNRETHIEVLRGMAADMASGKTPLPKEQ